MRCNPVLISLFALGLTACNGNGLPKVPDSGGGTPTPTLAPFVKFSSIAVPGTVRIIGSSQEATYSFNTNTQLVTSLSAPTTFAGGVTFDATYDVNGNLTKAVATSAIGTKVTVDTGIGDTISSLAAFPNVTAMVTANGQNFSLSANPSAFGWDYQTFGVWTTASGTGFGTVGAATVGAETAIAAIPTSGTGVYVGVGGGRYADSNGVALFVGSDMTATTDFTARSIVFSTTNTRTSPDLITSTSNANLNLSGTLTYSVGTNQFTGAVTSVGGGPANAAMTGTSTGKFYGPAAQEIGGTFTVSNGNAGFIGAFGGKR